MQLVGKLERLARVTEQRIIIRAEYTDLCEPPVLPDHARLLANENAAIHIYVTPEGKVAFQTPTARFPVGSVILKQKFTSPNAKEPEFYTGMLKREQGFNPECGDWEFFTLSGDRRAVTARGRIDSCMDCHRTYAKTDFVTKRIK